MSHPGSTEASNTASPRPRDAIGDEDSEAILNELLRTTVGSEQLDGISSSRESQDISPLHRTQSTGLVRRTSSSSISSLRRKRREDKQPEELHHSSNLLSHSDSSLPSSYREGGGGNLSDAESLDGRRVRTKYGSHSNRTIPLHGESSHGDQYIPERTSFSNTVPAYSHESFDADMQNLVDGTLSEFGRSGPPPPPPKGDEYMQLTRNRGTSQSSTSAGAGISLAQALLLEAPHASQGAPNYSNTHTRYRASSSSSGPGNILPAIPGSSSPIPLANIRQNSYVLPRWQSDAEVTFCPICKTQFSECFNGP